MFYLYFFFVAIKLYYYFHVKDHTSNNKKISGNTYAYTYVCKKSNVYKKSYFAVCVCSIITSQHIGIVIINSIINNKGVQQDY